jgi:glycosyltransferase involved in cell wall biosynthesis
MISILILTLNEEQNIQACLDSVRWCDDVVVLDSFSKDNTVPLAEKNGARVVQRKFDNWAAHQNWAMENIPFKHRWVFYLDADERMTPELRAEIEAIASNASEERVAFYCGRKNYFMGRWIKHCYPPSLLMRFFRPQFVRFERLVNPTPVINGPHGYLAQHFEHYNFSKGLSEWVSKHNQYSTLEALEGLKLESASLRGIFDRDPATRRKALKNLSFKLPCRSLLRFVYLYLVKRGIFDGGPGYHYCRLIAFYEYLIVLKAKETQLKEQGVVF